MTGPMCPMWCSNIMLRAQCDVQSWFLFSITDNHIINHYRGCWATNAYERLLKNVMIDLWSEFLASTIVMFFLGRPTLALGGPTAGSSITVVVIASTIPSTELGPTIPNRYAPWTRIGHDALLLVITDEGVHSLVWLLTTLFSVFFDTIANDTCANTFPLSLKEVSPTLKLIKNQFVWLQFMSDTGIPPWGLCVLVWALPTPRTILTIGSDRKICHLVSNCEWQRFSH